MKKILALILSFALACSLASCGEQEESSAAKESVSEMVFSKTSEDIFTEESSTVLSESSEVISSKYDDTLSQSATKMMESSFGGAGNPEYATSWYPYIQSISVGEDESGYFADMVISETPLDADLSTILEFYKSEGTLSMSDDEWNAYRRALLESGAALEWDSIDLCLAADDIYKIMTNDSPAIHFSSLYALGLDVYQYISDNVLGTPITPTEVMNRADEFGQPDFGKVILAECGAQYEGSYTGLSIDQVKTACNSLMANFKDVTIKKVSVYDTNSELIRVFKNPIK